MIKSTLKVRMAERDLTFKASSRNRRELRRARSPIWPTRAR